MALCTENDILFKIRMSLIAFLANATKMINLKQDAGLKNSNYPHLIFNPISVINVGLWITVIIVRLFRFKVRYRLDGNFL